MISYLTSRKTLFTLLFLFLTCSYLLENKYGVLSKVGFFENHFTLIHDSSDLSSLNVLKINHGDSFNKEEVIIKNGKPKTDTFTDCYGKDHFIIEFQNIQYKAKFKDFRFESWKKVNLKVQIKNNELTWEIQ